MRQDLGHTRTLGGDSLHDHRPRNVLAVLSRVAFVCAALGCAAFSGGCGRLVVSIDDALVTPDRRIRLVAYVERKVGAGFKKEIEHVCVRFYADGRQIAEARTDDEGRVLTLQPLDREAERVEARVVHGGEEARASAAVFRWRTNRPVIAVDLDGTVVRPDYDALLFESEDTESRAIADAQKTLSMLARDYEVFYLTARPWYLLDKTRRWLSDHEFPAGAVVTSPGWRQTARAGTYKNRTLAELRRDWPNILIGIGNRRGDAKAYRDNQMVSIMIVRHRLPAGGNKPVVVRNWTGVARFFAKHRATLSDPARLAEAVEERKFDRSPR